MVSDIKIYETTDELNSGAAELIAGLISSFIRLNFKCTFVLSGGSTPERLFTLLADNYKTEIDWKKVFLFWGDERYLPVDHPGNNYKMANEHLLSHVNIDPQSIFRINTDTSPEESAKEYEDRIKKFFGNNELPVFDVVLLGLGKDGHVASIFPGTDAVNEKEKWVAAVKADSLNTERITMTLPVINNAKNVIFLISGEDKKEIVEKIFIKKEKDNFPALMVKPQNGSLFYLMDRAAAGDMKTE
ncbi:MAG: 6-phosphogluconolactonase [Ignavibacteriae bacterium]|nr:MAG: 6-phosphogluconolactonase [Ignavibacteriota bacterium]